MVSRMRSPQPGMQRPSQGWIDRLGRMTEARARRLGPRVRFGVESLEARFLLDASGATDPKAGLSPITPPLVVMVTPPPANDPSPSPDPDRGTSGPAASTVPGPSSVLWVVNPPSGPSDLSGSTT